MDKFLQTKKGLEYLLETSPSDMSVDTAVNKAVDDYYRSQVEEQAAGWL
jgi:hypothetical protein